MSHTHPDKIDPLSIDCTIFGFEDGKLEVLLIRRAIEPSLGKWALPGGFILYQEDIDEASRRILREMTGMERLFMEQQQAFGAVGRYPNRRVITLAYFALIQPGKYKLNAGPEASDIRWFDVRYLPELPFDHEEIIQHAVNTLRQKVRHQPIGFELLPEKFTLLQLQELYEAILGQKLDKPNFRRKMQGMNLLVSLEEYQTGVAHRAARLYKFDMTRYYKLKESGFVFEV
ncbi:MAG: NUDIX domain-containing protein [Bacteroidia bacterium]|nr:NUDIX domain-containing protein [Bacteroidia bacterium]